MNKYWLYLFKRPKETKWWMFWNAYSNWMGLLIRSLITAGFVFLLSGGIGWFLAALWVFQIVSIQGYLKATEIRNELLLMSRLGEDFSTNINVHGEVILTEIIYKVRGVV
jgi:hypothetical protein